jgi:peroxiredoxin
MQEEYKADGLLIVGVTMQSDPVLVQTLIAKHGISYPLVVGNNKTIETYGLTGFPTVVVVGRDGAVVQVFDGMPQPGALRQTIAPLLAERTPA